MTANEELVVLVSPDGRATGTTPKATVHHADTPLHLAFSVYLFDDAGALLVTRRALGKATFPGVWTNSACGHPAPGEPVEVAVRRRTRDELGTEVSDLRLVLPRFSYRAEMDGVVEWELCPVLVGRVAGVAPEPRPDPSEVEDAEWVPWTEFRTAVLSGRRVVSSWCAEQVVALDALGPEPAAWPTADPADLPPAMTTERSAPGGLRVAPARAAGLALGAAFGVVARATGRKPLHAVGRTWAADLRIDAPLPDLAVPLLREPGVHPCTARVSWSLGTGVRWWDVGGLTVRIPDVGAAGGPADLLFATTGTGRVTRHLLRPVRQAAGRPLTTLLPVRAGGRSVMLLVRPVLDDADPRDFELAVSVDHGAWAVVGLLRLREEHPDTPTRYDPIVNQLAGTSTPAWVVAVREPAYRWSRRLTGRRPGEVGASGHAGRPAAQD